MASVDFDRDVYCVMGLPFDAIGMQTAVDIVVDAVRVRRPLFISTPNLNFVVAARREEAFRRSVLHSDLSLADGMPIVWIARLLGLPIPERVSGAGLFEALRQRTAPPIRVFFFGGADGVAAQACERLNQQPQGLQCVGHEAPGFGSLDELSTDEHLDRINRANADFVIVSLGAQKGQAWIERNRHRLNVPVISHLGAVVNFVAETVQRAPVWMQRTGMEWLWRIKEEPTLVRRYASDALAVLRLVCRDALWNVALRNRTACAPAPASAAFTSVAAGITVALSGCCSGGGVRHLRVALAKAAAEQSTVFLDLSGEREVDARAAALLALFSAHQRASNHALRLLGVGQTLRRQFASHGVDWLLSAA